MRLGFAVKVLGEGGLPSHDTRRWQSAPHLRHSIEAMHAVLGYLERHDIRMYRMTASLAPYATHPDLPAFHAQVDEALYELAGLGAHARALGIRLSTHPGQYVVLNSEHAAVQEAAIRDLELQAALFDALGLGPEAVAVIHVGGGGRDRPAGLDRWVAGWERLSERARARLVVENDDRTYALPDVMELHRRTGVPVVFDVLHHECCDRDGIPVRAALALALRTWPSGVRPKVHYSTPREPGSRAHADEIDPLAFAAFLDAAAGLEFDVMLEAKAKDLALLRLRERLATPPARGDRRGRAAA